MIVLLFQGIPEGIALTVLALVISRIPLKLNQILIIGTSLAITAYVIRLFPIPWGVHTIILILMLFVIVTGLSKGDVGLSFLASLLSTLVLVIFETACFSLYDLISSFTPRSLSPFHAGRIILGDIHVLLLFCTSLLLHKFYLKKIPIR